MNFKVGDTVVFKNKNELQDILHKHCYTYYHASRILNLSGKEATVKKIIPGGYLELVEFGNFPWKIRTTFVKPLYVNNKIPSLYGDMKFH